MKTDSTLLLKCICFFMVSVTSIQAFWSQTSGPGGGSISSFALNGKYVFAATYDGVFRTTVDETSWTQKNNGLKSTQITSIYAAAGIVFAVNSDGIFRSQNNGESWSKVNSGLAGKYITSLVSGDESIFAGTNRGMFRSSDGGKNWESVSEGLIDTFPPVDSNIGNITVNGETIFAQGSAGFFRSDDNGETWIPAGLEGEYISALGSDGETIIACTSYKNIYRSTDNGTTWAKTDSGSLLKTGYIASIIFCGDTIFATSPNIICRSFDKGVSWAIYHPAIPPFEILSFTAIGSTIFVGTKYGGVFRSLDFGSTWTSFNNSLTNSRVKFLVTDGNTVFAYTWQLAGMAGIFSTTDNGLTWNELNVSLPDTVTSGIEALAIAGGTILIGCSQGFYRSTDTGKNWTKITSLNNAKVRNLAADESSLFAILKDSVFLYRSNDDGDTWEKLDGMLPCSLSQDLVIRDSTIFLVSYMGGPEVPTGGIFRSLDYGRTWTRINSGLPGDAFISSIATSGNLVFISTLRHKVFLSSDNGDHWDSAGTGLSDNYLRAITATSRHHFVGGDRSSVWCRPIAEMAVVISKNKIRAIPDLKNYIISFIDRRISVQLSLSQREQVTVSIYDPAGHVIATIVDNKLDPGPHQFSINTHTLTTGCYLLSIMAGADIYTRKFIIYQ
jgi:photosystem II stability/assembly factor-like uncharacterized protein